MIPLFYSDNYPSSLPRNKSFMLRFSCFTIIALTLQTTSNIDKASISLFFFKGLRYNSDRSNLLIHYNNKRLDRVNL